MPYNFAAESFQTDFLREKSIFFYGKRKKIAFEALFGELEATYAIHLRLIGKLVVDFLLVHDN